MAVLPPCFGTVLAFVAILVLATASLARSVVEVAEHGGYFAGGEPVSLRGLAPRVRVSSDSAHAPPLDLNGDYRRGATYVEYTRLAHPTFPVPIVMFPGGGLSAASYQDTPDGRPGWEAYFLRHGYSVDIVDIDRTGRSPWRAFPEIDAQEPSFRNNAFLWETFRIGPPGSYAQRRAFPDTQFPLGSFEVLAGAAAPRFRPPPEEQSAAYDAVIRSACPCVLLVYSASGQPGLAAAQRWPGLVRAVVAVEPSAAPPVAGVPGKIPHVFLWADHLDPAETDSSWMQEYKEAQDFSKRLQAAGAPVQWINLTALGIRGNSHLVMMDRNSDQIAGIIDRALRRLLGTDKGRGAR